MGVDTKAELTGAEMADVVEHLHSYGKIVDLERSMREFDARGHHFVTVADADDTKRFSLFVHDATRFPDDDLPSYITLSVMLPQSVERETGVVEALCRRFGGWYLENDFDGERRFVEPAPDAPARSPLTRAQVGLAGIEGVDLGDVTRWSHMDPDVLREISRGVEALADALDGPAPDAPTP